MRLEKSYVLFIFVLKHGDAQFFRRHVVERGRRVGVAVMASQDRWFFSKEKLANTPSKRDGIDIRKELFYRQQAATLVQDMGQKLMVYPF